ncbi:hypothetical protein PHYBLDRAFT_64606 [Phycomyces blakesleeanus NRRL 1555(-)]|uniref:Uncharacterized protein n=1 Tax=Phycomyces blakesleeanus (strain ATCC 8743b / DSM 1359 / FGSC 10004 / NBRC 33097 / NRRL 1555) TaxID=763407 RepID=A0A162PGQ3_PHYB8|nr:hypothetical protein PHYBLDRAFT_64606 [Phycomyces blakesleeanus NRRL 1555(-)]OAD65536.1 hypothetical protein PHYBLDRAFT_64606 [Phycomyces blakesleeanus NRRL 1555(-)]|eukprot:XP_018283576.1 hypothetical protein PHYBLDRAFT_64606 [Phycomyces blakesleeanus NRRL 1555(-)]
MEEERGSKEVIDIAPCFRLQEYGVSCHTGLLHIGKSNALAVDHLTVRICAPRKKSCLIINMRLDSEVLGNSPMSIYSLNYGSIKYLLYRAFQVMIKTDIALFCNSHVEIFNMRKNCAN